MANCFGKWKWWGGGREEEEEGGNKKGEGEVVRLKVVMTKAEMVWLVEQLEKKKTDMKGGVRDVLKEMETMRSVLVVERETSIPPPPPPSSSYAWKPSLESICE